MSLTHSHFLVSHNFFLDCNTFLRTSLPYINKWCEFHASVTACLFISRILFVLRFRLLWLEGTTSLHYIPSRLWQPSLSVTCTRKGCLEKFSGISDINTPLAGETSRLQPLLSQDISLPTGKPKFGCRREFFIRTINSKKERTSFYIRFRNPQSRLQRASNTGKIN